MNYNQLQLDLEALEGGLEQMPPEESNTKHYVRMELANTLAHARELVEALANDEEWALGPGPDNDNEEKGQGQ